MSGPWKAAAEVEGDNNRLSNVKLEVVGNRTASDTTQHRAGELELPQDALLNPRLDHLQGAGRVVDVAPRAVTIANVE
jgi:hypothetical protein